MFGREDWAASFFGSYVSFRTVEVLQGSGAVWWNEAIREVCQLL